KQDWEKLCREMDEVKSWAQASLQTADDAVQKMETYIAKMTSILQTQYRLYAYGELTASVDAKNEKALQFIEKIQDQSVELVEPGVLFQKWLGQLDNLSELISQSDLLE
ncbi:oligoendopeptidase F, partial [Mesorhizobium sp. M00.F.Ca.ET.186.01.1.1]